MTETKDFEQIALDYLAKNDYVCKHAKDIERKSDEWILESHFKNALRNINFSSLDSLQNHTQTTQAPQKLNFTNLDSQQNHAPQSQAISNDKANQSTTNKDSQNINVTHLDSQHNHTQQNTHFTHSNPQQNSTDSNTTPPRSHAFTHKSLNLHQSLDNTTQSKLINEAYKKLKNLENLPLIEANEKMHGFLIKGINLELHHNGEKRGINLKLIDFKTPQNNEFLALNQLSFKDKSSKRPDIVLFVNGLPLVLTELKSPVNPNATIERAFNQIQNYKDSIPKLFIANEICVLSDIRVAKVGSISADMKRFLSWHDKSEKHSKDKEKWQFEVLCESLLKPVNLASLTHFTKVYYDTLLYLRFCCIITQKLWI